MPEWTLIKKKEANANVDKIVESAKVHILEKPDGKHIIIKIQNAENVKDKSAVIVTSPRKGITSALLKKAASMLESHPFFVSFFDSVPLDEYYIHAIFYGGDFSEDKEMYTQEAFSILCIEVIDHNTKGYKVGDFKMTQKFLIDTGLKSLGMYNAELPILHSGKPDMRKVDTAGNLSKLSINGEGIGAFIVCDPIYHVMTGELMIFES